MTTKIQIPYRFQPRQYQLPLLQAIDSGIKKAFVYWHRRAGKDYVLWNIFIKQAFLRKGIHYYYLPTFTQARRIIWDGISNDGVKFLDHIPKEAIKNQNNQEMKIELVNGSILQLIGTDRYNAVRGTNPITNIFSEYAYQNPQAYEIIKPIATANDGLMIFNTTPNGKNHSSDLREIAELSDEWFHQILTINDTKLLTEENLKQLALEGMSKEMIQQEYFCSESAGIVGSIYGDSILQVKEEDRICENIYDKNLPVYTAWDIGLSDDTAIVFFQLFGKEIRIIDFYSSFGELISHYVDVLRNKPYQYEKHFFPFDAKIKTLSSQGRSVVDLAKEYGLDKIDFAPSITLLDGINQVRQNFYRFWFDKTKTKPLVDALMNYRFKFDEKRKRHSKEPEHDWSSHACDAARYAVLSIPKQFKPKGNYEESAKKFIYFNSGKQYNPLGISTDDFKNYERELRESALTPTKDAF